MHHDARSIALAVATAATLVVWVEIRIRARLRPVQARLRQDDLYAQGRVDGYMEALRDRLS